MYYFCSRLMIQNWRTTEGWCFSTRFGAVYSLSSSYLVLANYYCICAGFARDKQNFAKVKLIYAEEISVARICGSYLLWVRMSQTSLVHVHSLTLPTWTQPQSFSKVTQSLPRSYITTATFSPGTGWQNRKRNCLWQKIVLSNAKLGDFNHSEAKTYRIKYLSHSRGAGNTAGPVFPRCWL